MNKKLLVLLVIGTVLLSACASVEKSVDSITSGSSEGDYGKIEAPMEPGRQAAYDEEIAWSGDTSTDSERLVIRNADLSIVVDDPAVVMEEIIQMAAKMGGFVVESNLYQSTYAPEMTAKEATITIRIPAERLDEVRGKIKAFVKDPDEDILSDTVSGRDVTADYTDLQSRLKNSEAAAEQLRLIMGRATDPEDVLRVFSELRAVNEQIELLKGQIKYYEESAALSAVSVRIKADESIQPVEIGGWKPKGVARDALQALIDAYQFIANAAIWIVVFCLPIAIPVGVALYFIIRAARKLRKKSKLVKDAEADVENIDSSLP
jgi:major membrane immunogen (membrane-anchored lipoprotein)